MRKIIISLIIASMLLSNVKAQDEIVFKNMAAVLQRSLDNNKKWGGLTMQNDFVHIIMYILSKSNDVTRSLHKIRETKDTGDAKKEYLLKGTLNYYLDHYKPDSTMIGFVNEINPYINKMCQCLEENYYSTTDSFKNTVFVYCMNLFFQDTTNRKIIKQDYQNINPVYYFNRKKLEAFIILTQRCRYYREFVIRKIITEVALTD